MAHERASEQGRGQAPAQVEVYRTELLVEARVDDGGVLHRRDLGERRIPWARIEAAFAAEVGEPEGVRTIVFDLALGAEDGECLVARFDAEPGEEAAGAARRIERGIGRERCAASLRDLAKEGVPTARHPDLESFGEASFEALRRI